MVRAGSSGLAGLAALAVQHHDVKALKPRGVWYQERYPLGIGREDHEGHSGKRRARWLYRASNGRVAAIAEHMACTLVL